ncbi:MAG: hypothetical protein HYV37_01545 [Candidatus Levyibacteriota bacterium]|nr:MAG: hypothetical protein HYV37_01545 [Candidatus Levybacteria bacterium]
MKHFYSHLIETSTLSLALGDMELSQVERLELLSLAHENLHHAVLDTVLSELSENDKKLFLQHLAVDNHDKIWELLKSKVENIEEKIKKAAESLKEELHKDILEARHKKN